MRGLSCAAAVTAATFITSISALNILINNDDGFASANIREFYNALVADGHDVVMVAPVNDQSGMGGRSVFTTSSTLLAPSEYNLIPAGAPSLGQDPTDSNIWYYNGTPAACTFVALDYVIPTFYENRTIDLLVAGPNFGTNLGPFVWTLSGTAGATYAAVSRNIPAIAFSSGNTGQRSYTEVNTTTPSGQPDPAIVGAQLSAAIVSGLANATSAGDRLLPLGYGLNVNYAAIDTLSANPKCTSPTFYQTRMTGGAATDSAVRNATTGLFHYGNAYTDGVNACINGNCSLPGETEVVNAGCYGSISVFTIDYDAPTGNATAEIGEKLSGVAMTGAPSAVLTRRGLSAVAYEASIAPRHE